MRTFPDLAVSKVYYWYSLRNIYTLCCIFQHCFCFAVLEYKTDSLFRICRIYRNVCSACLDCSEDRAHHFHTSVCNQSNEIVWSYSYFFELFCNTVRSCIQLFVCNPIVKILHRYIFRSLFHLFFKKLYNRLILRIISCCCVEYLFDKLPLTFCDGFCVSDLFLRFI